MTIIRPAKPDDAQDIAHVHVEAWRSAYRDILPPAFLDGLSENTRQETWQAILNKHASAEFNFVAERDSQVVGFASGGPERKNDPHFSGELYAIYLLNEHRGQGIGMLLFHKSVKALLALGMDSMKVWVLKDNPYRAFYEQRGGKLVGEDTIRIGEMDLPEVAYGWSDLRQKLD